MSDLYAIKVKRKCAKVSDESLKTKFLGISDDGSMLLEVFEYHNQQLKEPEGTNYASATVKRY
jgi:hypothetical protein